MNLSNLKKTILKSLLVSSAVLTIVSCAHFDGPAKKLSKIDKQTFSSKLREPKPSAKQEEPITLTIDSEDGSIVRTEVRKAPSLSVKQKSEVASDVVLPKLDNTNKISRLSFNNMPVSAFINEIFGNQLGLGFVIEPQVAKASDLITMRLASPLDARALYRVATQTLAPYGVTTAINDDILVFSFSEDASAQDTPLLVSGKALPEVPSSNRPLFYIYPLKSVGASNVVIYLKQLFKPNELNIKPELDNNAVIFQGTKARVEQGIAAAKLFDQPEMTGMHSRIFNPQSGTVSELSFNLEQILKTEGFAVSTGDSLGTAIKLLPLESVGQLIVFAKSKEVLEHIESWISAIEIRTQSEIEEGFFSYAVQSTLATHVVTVLGELGVTNYSASESSSEATEDSDIGNLSAGNVRSTASNRRTRSGNSEKSSGLYTVDEKLNTILFKGSGKEWLKVLPVIKRLDKPAPSVMIEAIVVEVTLNDETETGVQWLARAGLDRFTSSSSTNFEIDNAGSGFAFSLVNPLDSAGITRATINAFYQNDQATIRSRPRLMVKSGEEATFDALTRIPIISSTIQSTETGTAPTVQNVNYLDTGVTLEIKPTVHASGFVDIEVTQSFSQSTTEPGAAGNPEITERRINTKVTLRDGGSVLLGGLISSATSDVNQGVPLLGKLPFIGKLFSADFERQDRTELMIMIIPYVSNSPIESEALTDELQLQRLRDLNIH
ncbi:type II and III secretion system protein [Agaribacter flavus]|uniref:Type II and III secretion system protein n=1 Tax=Agaribacter flavus TaxID=1902781 RepID=A0ABV7FNR8_9ALTE